jgi:hypothetical protein
MVSFNLTTLALLYYLYPPLLPSILSSNRFIFICTAYMDFAPIMYLIRRGTILILL